MMMLLNNIIILIIRVDKNNDLKKIKIGEKKGNSSNIHNVINI